MRRCVCRHTPGLRGGVWQPHSQQEETATLRHPALRASPARTRSEQGLPRPIPAPIPAVCRGHSGPASGGGAPGAELQGRESPVPGDTGRGEGCGSRGTGSVERERYERFNVRHIKNPNLAHHQRSGIRQEHGKRPVSV